MYIPTKKEIDREIEKGYVKRITSDQYPEFVKYKYTDLVNFENEWNEVSKFCRGVIFDKEHNLIALPAGKVFNINEQTETEERNIIEQYESYATTEKKDGVSIIVQYIAGEDIFSSGFLITTLGSLDNEFIDRAKDLFYAKKIDRMCADYAEDSKYNLEDFTFQFELISPVSKIILNYDEEELYLFSVRNKINGKYYLDNGSFFKAEAIFDKTVIYNKTDEFDLNLLEIKQNSTDDIEGFVVHCFNEKDEFVKSVKVKTDHYMKRSRFKNHLSIKGIYESIISGELDLLIEENRNIISDEDMIFIKMQENNFYYKKYTLEYEAFKVLERLFVTQSSTTEMMKERRKWLGMKQNISKSTKSIVFSALKEMEKTVNRQILKSLKNNKQ